VIGNGPRSRSRGRRDSLLFPEFNSCPHCHGTVRAATVVDLMVFVCTTCGSYWHVELGVVYRVAPPSAAAS
jgi:hypothetical protein